MPRRIFLHVTAMLSLVLGAVWSDDAFEPPVHSVSIEDGFDLPGSGRWEPGAHALGRGFVRAEHVALGRGAASLTLPAGSFDGAEIRSMERFGYGTYGTRMKTPRAPGTLSAFFLYQGGSDIADELDIEVFNDGSRRVMFTTWVAGKTTNSVTLELPFDPAAGFHDYRIEWSSREVRFVVDGVVMQEWREGLPTNPMFVMANTWWPTWISGPMLDAPQTLQIECIHASS